MAVASATIATGDRARRTSVFLANGTEFLRVKENLAQTLSPLAEYIARRFMEITQDFSEDASFRRRDYVIASLACLGVFIWLIEFLFVVYATFDNLYAWTDNGLVCQDTGAGYDLILQHFQVRYPPISFVCQGLYTLISVTMAFMVLNYYQLLLKSDIRKRAWDSAVEGTNLLTSRKLRIKFLLEFVVCIAQPLPFSNVEYERSRDYSKQTSFYANQVNWGIFLVLRLYWVLRVVRDRTTVYRKRRDIEIMKNGRELVTGWSFAIRSVYHKHSPRACFVFCVGIGAFFSLAFYVTEWSELKQMSCDENGNIQSFELRTAVYLALITLATVGYGDIAPKSALGRGTACVCAIMAIVVSAVVTTTFMRWLELSGSELGAMGWCFANKYATRERDHAAMCIQNFVRARQKFKLTSRRRPNVFSQRMDRVGNELLASEKPTSRLLGIKKNGILKLFDRTLMKRSHNEYLKMSHYRMARIHASQSFADSQPASFQGRINHTAAAETGEEILTRMENVESLLSRLLCQQETMMGIHDEDSDHDHARSHQCDCPCACGARAKAPSDDGSWRKVREKVFPGVTTNRQQKSDSPTPPPPKYTKKRPKHMAGDKLALRMAALNLTKSAISSEILSPPARQPPKSPKISGQSPPSLHLPPSESSSHAVGVILTGSSYQRRRLADNGEEENPPAPRGDIDQEISDAPFRIVAPHTETPAAAPSISTRQLFPPPSSPMGNSMKKSLPSVDLRDDQLHPSNDRIDTATTTAPRPLSPHQSKSKSPHQPASRVFSPETRRRKEIALVIPPELKSDVSAPTSPASSDLEQKLVDTDTDSDDPPENTMIPTGTRDALFVREVSDRDFEPGYVPDRARAIAHATTLALLRSRAAAAPTPLALAYPRPQSREENDTIHQC